MCSTRLSDSLTEGFADGDGLYQPQDGDDDEAGADSLKTSTAASVRCQYICTSVHTVHTARTVHTVVNNTSPQGSQWQVSLD